MLWQNRPPKPAEFAGVRLGRVQPGKDLEAIILSDKLLGCYTHFWRKRTVPCASPDCPACCDGIPARWHGYLSVWSTRTRLVTVLELTSLAGSAVADYEDRHGSLRGALLHARRLGSRPNSPVQIAITPNDCDLRTLPRQINIERFLETIWGLAETSQQSEVPPNIRNNLQSHPSGRTPQPEQPPEKSAPPPAAPTPLDDDGRQRKSLLRQPPPSVHEPASP